MGPAVIVLLSALWFRVFAPGAIAFDDIGAVLHWRDTQYSFTELTLLDVTANRWRPVFSAALLAAVRLFGEDYAAYFWFNVALTAALALLVYAFARQLSGSRAIATATGVLVLTARFSYYQVTQVIGGPLETLCLILFVLLAYAMWSFERSGRTWHLALALAYYTLILHTHERYFVLVGFLIPVVLTTSRLRLRARFLWSAAFLVPLALSIAVRVLVLDIPLLVGTGSSTELGFTPWTAATHYLQSLAQTGGVNLGPEYLHGITFPYLAAPWKVACIGVGVLVLATVVAAALTGRRGWRQRLLEPSSTRLVLAAVLLILVTIVSFSITIRVEPRWIYAPFVVWTLTWAYACGVLSRRRRARPAVALSLVLVTVLSVALNVQYRSGVAGQYFLGARTLAVDVLAKTVGVHGVAIASQPVYVVDPTTSMDWTVYLPQVIAVNSDVDGVSVTQTTSFAEIPGDADAFVFDVTGGFHEVEAPASGYHLVGDAYGDGWVGESFGVRGACSMVSVTIKPYLVDPELEVTFAMQGGAPQVYALDAPELTVQFPGDLYGGALDVTFERAFIPADEGSGADVRALAGVATVACVPPAG